MKKELDEKLCADFPKLFSDRHAPITQTAMTWGFECGPGWYDLLRECSAKLEAINDKIKDSEHYIRATQIKEKYGTLRFYTSGIPQEFSEEAYKAIEEAEQKSEETCEQCGAPGKTVGTGWLRTTCKNHEND